MCIFQADVIQLKSFLSVLRLAVQGKSLDNITLSSLAPASAKNLEPPKTSMIILDKKDYPTTKNFPSSLESLQVCLETIPGKKSSAPLRVLVNSVLTWNGCI